MMRLLEIILLLADPRLLIHSLPFPSSRFLVTAAVLRQKMRRQTCFWLSTTAHRLTDSVAEEEYVKREEKRIPLKPIYRPTVDAKNEIFTGAEDHQASVKKGKYEKRSIELNKISLLGTINH